VKKARVLVVSLALAAGLAVMGVASAAPAPPTEGGNGGGSSGQCTGNPDDRPNVCPATP
jgi:hypothetical protein